MKSKTAKFVTLFSGVILLMGVSLTTLTAHPAFGTSVPQQADSALTALQEGRRLLKRGKADQALGQFQTSLKLYTAASNNRGMAAAHNELGDLYLRQGQYNVALDHYKQAHENFVSAQQKASVEAALGFSDDKFNANLMLAKIGDVNFRLGKIPEATAAYGQMEVKKPESVASKVGGRFGGGLSGLAGGLAGGGKPSIAAPTSALGVAGEIAKEIDGYRNSIVYSSYQLGMGRSEGAHV